MSYETLYDHREMLLDSRRNEIYRTAIARAVQPGSVVLDLGAGLGLHGFMAAVSGASKVYMVEPGRVLNITRQIMNGGKFAQNIVCLDGKIEDVQLPEPVDVIISVFTGNFLISEDLLPSLFYAREHFLKPGGIMLPDRAEMIVAPAQVSEFYEANIDCWQQTVHGLDLSGLRTYAVNSLFSGSASELQARLLSRPGKLNEVEFHSADHVNCDHSVTVRVTEDGVCHGFLGWFNAMLGDQLLSTAPDQPAMHWRQVFLPVGEPVAVSKGDELNFALKRPDFGEWTWTITSPGGQQRQSTFLSEPRLPAVMEKKSPQYRAKRTEKGSAILQVLIAMDGETSTTDIAEKLLDDFPDQFKNERAAIDFAVYIAERYS